MQTFLPLPPVNNRFTNTGAILDYRRLGKERVEGFQILKCLVEKETRWKNHPAVLQWKGYERSLYEYVQDICISWIARGYNDTIMFKLDTLNIPDERIMPPWMGNDKIHASHRSRLLFKGRVDAAILSLKSWLPKGYKLNEWLDKACYPTPNVFTQQNIKDLEDFLALQKVNIGPNHYSQFGWEEPDNLPYVWPVTKELIECGLTGKYDLEERMDDWLEKNADKIHKLVEKHADKIRELE